MLLSACTDGKASCSFCTERAGLLLRFGAERRLDLRTPEAAKSGLQELLGPDDTQVRAAGVFFG